MIEQLGGALEVAGLDAAVRGVIIAGEGHSFCAGVDLQEFSAGTPASGELLIRSLQHLCATVRRLPKPVAAAIQGSCLGGALELAACCDLRVSTSDASLGMPEVYLGIPSVIDAVMLQHLVGTGRAHELLLTGDPLSGAEAHRWGLVNRVVAEPGLVAATASLLRLVTRHEPAVIAAQKRLHEDWMERPYGEAVERSIEPLLEAFRDGRPQRLAAERVRGR